MKYTVCYTVQQQFNNLTIKQLKYGTEIFI